MKNFSYQCWIFALFLGTIVAFSSYSQTVINSENFETGGFPFTIWNDGGFDCDLNSSSILSGNDCAFLDDNTSSSNMFTSNIDLSAYQTVTISFDFRTSGYDSGEDFFIEFSSNGGSSWSATPILQYVRGTHFNDNTTYTGVLATVINGATHTFSTTSRFRFRSDSSDDGENLYLDNIVITAYSVSTDTDGDGIDDSVDLDDDNDGIIDTYECSATIQFNNPSLLTATTLNDVKAGEKIVYSDAILYQNTYYDIVLTIISKNGSFTIDCNNELRIDTFDASADEYVTYSFDLVVAGSATPGNTVGVPAVLYDMILESRDIDTRSGKDFTEIAGFNPSTVTSTVTGYLTSTTNLEQAGFVNGGAPGGYTTYRLDPTIVAPNTDWNGEPDDGGTQGDDPDFYLYMEFDRFSHVDLIYGSTGTETDTGTRLTIFGISSVCDSDRDGLLNTQDIDSDNDGIPDNVEAQPTIGYIPPGGTINAITGIWDVYGTGLVPVDTDGDNLIDMYDLDTDSDGVPDIEENGMANLIVVYTDLDNDGLDDLFEGGNLNDPTDINDEIDDPTDLSILPDVDLDLFTGGDLDYRDYFDGNPPPIATLDFDGVNDYLSRNSFMVGLDDVTMMAWVNTDSGNSTDMTIAGEDVACKLWLEDGNKPSFTIKTLGNSAATIGCSAINFDEWHHLAGSFSSSTGLIKLYVDGVLVNTLDTGVTGAPIAASSNANDTFEIGRFSNESTHGQYYKGDIDEVRVFNVLLTENQIQRMVYQEIENNSGNVKGTIIAKNIIDISTSAPISWSNLIAYYPMTDIKTGVTLDYSSYGRTIRLYNITTILDQTAPMPYQTKANGAWAAQGTWLHGDVWDIEDFANNKDWSIIKISHDVSACHSIKTIGLIVDAGYVFNVHTDFSLENSWYLELNGTIDLEGDAQLIQTTTSDLVTSATGKILRRQEGTSNKYRYNYWSSPVGTTGLTSLTDNNASTNNMNNTAFKLNMLKDEAGFNMQFISAYDQVGKISTYWLYTFKNGLTYWDWANLSPSAALGVGVGYTQKGTGNAGMEQQYIFEGKPNNGTILVNVTDKGGAGSVPNVSKTEYLLGNPYPSALDIHKFIDDNAGVIGGSLQLWQQWGGNSHNLSEYEGGYAQVNKLGSVRAYQFVGFYGATNGSQDGTVTPSRYLPVGQGFLAEIVANGTVEFNNGQRIFIKESDADGTYGNGSSFFKSSDVKRKKNNSDENNQTNPMQKIRLELSSVSGPATRRELLLGFSETTSDGFDYGYDAECTESTNNDFNLNFEGKNMNIQAYGPIDADKVVSLNFKSSGSNSFEIKITESENLEDGQKVYLRDNLTGTYFDLTGNTAYRFSSEQGKFNKRFEMVFQSESQTLGAEESTYTENFIYYQNSSNTLFAKKLNTSISKLALMNMNGQTVLELKDVSQETLSNGLKIPNVATGAYIACFRTDDNQVFTKKIILN